MQKPQGLSCPDCVPPVHDVSRRDFVRTVGAAAIAAATPLFIPRAGLFAAPGKDSPAESAVGRLYASFSEAQKKQVCFPFDHESRMKIHANWKISEPDIGSDFYTTEQRGLITEILKGVTSGDGYERLLKQTEFDNGGVNFYQMAIFGDPSSDKFEWEMTGRHLTIRADGNSVPGAAFGGPIVYGHGEEDPSQNLFFYQTQQANEVFKALDPKQREQALLTKAPQENAVQLQGAGKMFPGIAVSELSQDQRKLLAKTVRTLLAPYREADVEEAMAMIKEGGGMKSLNMAFYKDGDIGEDQQWDIWRIEGPNFVSHFRGSPHVHAYLNVGIKQA